MDKKMEREIFIIAVNALKRHIDLADDVQDVLDEHNITGSFDTLFLDVPAVEGIEQIISIIIKDRTIEEIVSDWICYPENNVITVDDTDYSVQTAEELYDLLIKDLLE